MFKHQHIIKRGQVSEGIYIVHSGEVDFLYSDKPRIPLITIGHSGVIGDSFVLGEPELMTASIRSNECVLLYIPLAYLLETIKNETTKKQVLSKLNGFSLAKLIMHKVELVNFLTIVNSILSLIQKHRPQFRDWKGCSRKTLQSILSEVEFEIQDYLSYDHEYDMRLQELVREAVHFNVFRFVRGDLSASNLYDPRLPVADHEQIASEMNSRIETNPTREFKISKKQTKTEVPQEVSEVQTQRQRRIVSLIEKSDAPTRKEASLEYEPIVGAPPVFKLKKNAKKKMGEITRVPATFTFGRSGNELFQFDSTRIVMIQRTPYRSQGGPPTNQILDQLDSIEYRSTPRSNSVPCVDRGQPESSHKRCRSVESLERMQSAAEKFLRSQSVLAKLKPLLKRGAMTSDWPTPPRQLISELPKVVVPPPKLLSLQPRRKDSNIECNLPTEEPGHFVPRVKDPMMFNRFKRKDTIELATGLAVVEKSPQGPIVLEDKNRPKNSLLQLVSTPGRLSTAPGSQNRIELPRDAQRELERVEETPKTQFQTLIAGPSPTNAPNKPITPNNLRSRNLRNQTKVLCTIIKSGLMGPIELDAAALPVLLDSNAVNITKFTLLEPNDLFTKVAKDLLAAHCVRGNKCSKSRQSVLKKRKNQNRYLAILDEKEDMASSALGALGHNENLLAAQEYQNLDLEGGLNSFNMSDKDSVCSTWHEDFPYIEIEEIAAGVFGSHFHPSDPNEIPEYNLLDSPKHTNSLSDEVFNTRAHFSLVQRRCKVITANIAKELHELIVLLDRIENLQQ